MKKPKGWYTGIVHLWQLNPEKIYVDLQEPLKTSILKKAKQITKTWTNLARAIDLKISSCCVNQVQSFKRGLCTKLPFIIKLCEFLVKNGHQEFKLKNVEKQISRLNSGYGSNFITNPKLPFNFNTVEGVTIISAIFHDGHFSEGEIQYCNTNKKLREEVACTFKKFVGNCRLNCEKLTIRFPTVFGIVLKDGIGLIPGPKLKTDPEIPQFILESNETLSGTYLRQAFDDDGSTCDCVSIALETRNKNKPPRLLSGIAILLEKLNIEYRGPHFLYPKISKSGKIGYVWRINIHRKSNLKIFRDKVGFHLDYKQKNLEALLLRRHKFGQGKAIEELLAIAKKIEKEKGKITSRDLAVKTGRSKSIIQKHLKRMLEKGLIKKIKNFETKGNIWLPAEYKVVV